MKNLQRLQGIDGDYDNDSGSGPDRIARRRTILNLDKAAKPRRQIGTLDVAFKKRFLQLTAADENNPSKDQDQNRSFLSRYSLKCVSVFRNSNIRQTHDNATRDDSCIRSAQKFSDG